MLQWRIWTTLSELIKHTFSISNVRNLKSAIAIPSQKNMLVWQKILSGAPSWLLLGNAHAKGPKLNPESCLLLINLSLIQYYYFVIDIPNSALNVYPTSHLIPQKPCTNVFVESSVHNFWSDSRITRPFLRLAKMSYRTSFSLPSPTLLEVLLFSGQRDRSWWKNSESMEGSEPPVEL